MEMKIKPGTYVRGSSKAIQRRSLRLDTLRFPVSSGTRGTAPAASTILRLRRTVGHA